MVLCGVLISWFTLNIHMPSVLGYCTSLLTVRSNQVESKRILAANTGGISLKFDPQKVGDPT